MDTLTKAIRLAARLHAGQVDKSDQPYILHPLRVMLAQTDPTAQVVAVLHDVIEDSELSLAELARDFSTEIVSAVDALSRREGEDYSTYLDRAFDNRLARLVKRADLNDNLSRAYHSGLIKPEKIRQYEAALDKLNALEATKEQPS